MEMNEVERWTAKRRSALIVSILREEITIIEYYNTERPHQALGYLSPKEFRPKKGQQVA